MAQPQQNITLSSPGFMGLNLEDAPIDMDQRYALQADNAVIDRFGRLGARKGFTPFLASSPDPSAVVRSLGRIIDGDVVRYLAVVESGSDIEVWELTDFDTNPIATLMPLPAGYTLPSAEVQIVTLGVYGLILSEGGMLYIENGAIARADSHPSWHYPRESANTPMVTEFNPTTGAAAYGRLWATGGELGSETIYYSDLNNPFWWYDGSASPTYPLNTGGVIDVYEAWPAGKDHIKDIVGHNNMLVVFGRSSLLVYGNPQGDPAATGGIYLADTVSNIGLVSGDALASDGRDLLFVDDTGLRSLGRTIQEQSAALGDLSRTVRTQLQAAISKTLQTGGSIRLVYDPTSSFVLLILNGDRDVWCFDTRQPMEDGSYRATRWPGAAVTSGLYVEEGEKLLLGYETDTPMVEYTGNADFYTQSYNFTYSSPSLSFGDPVRTKLVKQIDYTVVSGITESMATGSWQYIGTRPYEKSRFFPLLGGEASYFDDSNFEYNGTAQYGTGGDVIRSYKLNADASGENVIIKFAAEINNSRCSLQQINIQALLGRIN
jgi:hypothetical protein